MQLWNAREADSHRLVDETRALFILKRATADGEPSFEWIRNAARILTGSPNLAIAAEARRLEFGFDAPQRPQRSAIDDPEDTVLWVAFPRDDARKAIRRP